MSAVPRSIWSMRASGTSPRTWPQDARPRGVRFVVAVLIDVFRAAPPLVLLIFVHAGLPFAGLRLSPFASVCVAFFLNNSAYYGEIYRAGLGSVGAGQREAARSTGLTAWQAMAFVVIPQAVRNVLPDLVSNTVEVVKLTSLASVVALPEMLYSADMARSLTYNSSPIVLAALNLSCVAVARTSGRVNEIWGGR
jgi:polar amino acid transport system permease protein